MFLFPIVLISLSLLSYGGVLPWNAPLLALAWLLAGFSLVAWRAVKGQINVKFCAFLFGVALLSALGHFRLAATIAPAGWFAWYGPAPSWKRVLPLFVLIGLLEAVLGIVQSLAAPGWIFGYHNAVSSVSGTLINRNHYAGLLELLAPAAIACALFELEKRERAKAYLYVLAAALIGVATVLSLSRMGIACLLFSTAILGLLARRRSQIGRGGRLVGWAFAAMLAVLSVWIGIDTVVLRYEQLTEADAVMRQARTIVYRDTLKLIAAHPGGVGIDRYQDYFRTFQTWRPDLYFDHAHNEFLETMAEWGVLPALAFWAIIVMLVIQAARRYSTASPTHAGLLLGCIGGMVALLLHSLADFNLQIPSNGMIFFSLLGLSTRPDPKETA